MDSLAKVAVAQLSPVYLNLEDTVSKACSAIREAGRHGAELVAFPECFIPGYPYFAMLLAPIAINDFLRKLHREAVEIPSSSVDALCEAAREAKIHVVMGLTERDGGTLYNGQLFIGPDGTILGRRRKLVPTSFERLVHGRGDGSDLALFPTALGLLGGLVCYEHSNALFRYALQGEGEQIHVAMWPGGLPSINGIIDAASRHYAFEAQAFVLSVTAVVSDQILEVLGDAAGGVLSLGGGCSSIISPRGDFLAGPMGGEEGLLYADLDFSLITKMKTIVDSAGHYARPDVLHLEIDRRSRKSILDGG